MILFLGNLAMMRTTATGHQTKIFARTDSVEDGGRSWTPLPLLCALLRDTDTTQAAGGDAMAFALAATLPGILCTRTYCILQPTPAMHAPTMRFDGYLQNKNDQTTGNYTESNEHEEHGSTKPVSLLQSRQLMVRH